jgi:anti-anti-sigma factor
MAVLESAYRLRRHLYVHYPQEAGVLRITKRTQSSDEVVLKVEGWISGEEVSVLQEEGIRWLEQAGRLVLDLTGVRFIDRAGIAVLQGWQGDRLVLCGATPFVRALLETHGLA